MDELAAIIEQARKFRVQLDTRGTMVDRNHLGQVWSAVELLAHHQQQLYIQLASLQPKR